MRTSMNKPAKRAYAGVTSPTLEDWMAGSGSADNEILGGGSVLRNRARSLERDDPYIRRFLAKHCANVVGCNGFSLESMAGTRDPSTGKIIPDKSARLIIEDAWEEFKRAKNITVSGDMTYGELKTLSERACARDGGRLLRVVRNFNANSFGISFQLLEIDRIDARMDRRIGRNKVVGGIEFNQWARPVAYHLYDEHPGDVYSWNGGKRTRVTARNLNHRFYRDRAEQKHGASLASCAIVALRQLNKYTEAEVVAARTQACATISWEKTAEYEEDEGDDYDTFENFELEPGGSLNPGMGVKPNLLQPTHPNGNYDEFQKALTTGISAGLLMNYPMLSGDLQGVSYSGLREGKLDVQSMAKVFRKINIDLEERWMFEQWLEHMLVTGRLGLPFEKFDQFNRAEFYGEGFPWVDPQKEVNATQTELEIGSDSLSRVVRERKGVSLERMLTQQQEDEKLFEDLGLAKPEWMTKGGSAAQTNGLSEQEPESDSEDDNDEIEEETGNDA